MGHKKFVSALAVSYLAVGTIGIVLGATLGILYVLVHNEIPTFFWERVLF